MNTRILVCLDARWIEVLVYSSKGGLCYIEPLAGPSRYDDFIDALINLHIQWSEFPEISGVTVEFLSLEEVVENGTRKESVDC